MFRALLIAACIFVGNATFAIDCEQLYQDLYVGRTDGRWPGGDYKAALALTTEEAFLHALAPYLAPGKAPDYWVTYYETELAAGRAELLDSGGPRGGSHRIRLPDGRTAIARKKFRQLISPEIGASFQVSAYWSEKNIGPKLLAAGLRKEKSPYPPFFHAYVAIEEDLQTPVNRYGRLVVGDTLSKSIHGMKDAPVEMKERAIALVQHFLDRHSDPHPDNIFLEVREPAPTDVISPAPNIFEWTTPQGQRRVARFSNIDSDGEAPLVTRDIPGQNGRELADRHLRERLGR